MEECKKLVNFWGEGKEIGVRDNCVAFAAEIIGISLFYLFAFT